MKCFSHGTTDLLSQKVAHHFHAAYAPFCPFRLMDARFRSVLRSCRIPHAYSANTVLYRGVETISAGFHTPAAVSRIPALFGFCHGLQRTTRRLFRRLDLWHSSDRQVYRNPIDWRGVLLTFYVPRVSLFFSSIVIT